MHDAAISRKAVFWIVLAMVLFGVLLRLALHQPVFGWAGAIAIVSIVGLLNAQLGLRDRVIGVTAGCAIGLLVGAALLGSGVAWPLCLIGIAVGALVGYFFGASEVSPGEESESSASEHSDRSGGGGKFDGGGASDRY